MFGTLSGVQTAESAQASVRFDFEDGVDADSFEEGVVVADDEKGSAVGVECLGELFDAGDVEVVGGFVEDQ